MGATGQDGTGPICILVTGFGAFPGTRKNPTAALVQALGKHKPRLARLGIRLELALLPVAFAEIAPGLEALSKAHEPDAILHFGLAARRKVISIETRAVNRLSLLHPDATGATAGHFRIRPGAAPWARATYPSVEIAAALHRAGIACRLSNDAGKYICNETLYLSLARDEARQVGFIHVPRLATRTRCSAVETRHRPSLDDLTRAALTALLVMAHEQRSRAGTSPRRKRDDASDHPLA